MSHYQCPIKQEALPADGGLIITELFPRANGNPVGRVNKPKILPTHLWNAHSRSLALELLVAAVVGRPRRAALLVRGVVAIRDAVALVTLVDALRNVHR